MLSNAMKPEEYYETLVLDNPKEICNVPFKYVTDKMLKHVILSGYASVIPKNWLTPEIVIFYLENNEGTYKLNWIPERILGITSVQKTMLMYCPGKMYKIPARSIDHKMLKDALLSAGLELYRFLPYCLKTKENSLVAYKGNKAVFKYMPDKHKDEDLCVDAVKDNIKNLSYVPKNVFTPKFIQRLCDEGVEIPPMYKEFVNSIINKDKDQKVVIGTASQDESNISSYLIEDFPLYFAVKKLSKFQIVTLRDLEIFIESELKPDGEKVSDFTYNELRALNNALKILKCKLFGEDPGVHLETKDLSIEEGTIQFGLTKKSFLAIQRACAVNQTTTFNELLVYLFYPDRAFERKYYFSNTSSQYKELCEKYFVVKNYYDSKSKGVDNSNVHDIDLRIKLIEEQMAELQIELSRLRSIKASRRAANFQRNRKIINEKGKNEDDK